MPSLEKPSSKETVDPDVALDPDVVAADPDVATLIDDVFGLLPSSTPTKDSTDNGSLVDPDTNPQFEPETNGNDWPQRSAAASRQMALARASPRDILRDRIANVLNGIDCDTVKPNGFAHLFNNMFTPLKDISIFKLMEMRKLSWSTLKCPQVCIIIYYQLML